MIENKTDETKDRQYFPPTKPRLAIADLVHSIIGDSRKMRRDLLECLGYKNKNKAALRFDLMLTSGEFSPLINEHLPLALGIEEEVLQKAIQETNQQKVDHETALQDYRKFLKRALFHPHIYVEIDYSKRLVSSKLWALLGRRGRRIKVPVGLPFEPADVQVAVVGELIAGYVGSEDHGLCVRVSSGPASYTYKPFYGAGWEFSAGGDYIGKVLKE